MAHVKHVDIMALPSDGNWGKTLTRKVRPDFNGSATAQSVYSETTQTPLEIRLKRKFLAAKRAKRVKALKRKG